MTERKRTRITRLASIQFALAGLGFMLRTEPNAQIHAGVTVLAVGAGLVFGLTPGDWRWVIAAVAWVWTAEALNTAFEHLCDAVSPEFNVSVQRAKDVAAGAVLASATGAALVGAMVFLPYLAAYVSRPGL